MKAWIENDKIRDIAKGNPAELYHPSVAAFYDTEVPEDAENGDMFIDGVLTKPEPVVPQEPVEPPTVYPKISPVEFKLLFTGPERIAIRIAGETDELIKDFYEIIDDPRLKEVNLGLQSTQDGIGYLALQGLIAPERIPEILTGIFK
jgi:hypothetical protein